MAISTPRPTNALVARQVGWNSDYRSKAGPKSGSKWVTQSANHSVDHSGTSASLYPREMLAGETEHRAIVRVRIEKKTPWNTWDLFVVNGNRVIEEKQVVFFLFDEGVTMPDHAHCEQHGLVISGEMVMEVEGKTNLYTAGDHYRVPEGVPHRASFSKPTLVIDMSDAPDRYVVSA